MLQTQRYPTEGSLVLDNLPAGRTLRLALVLAATALLAWGFEALLFEHSSQLSYLYQWPLLLASLCAGLAYLPLRSRLAG